MIHDGVPYTDAFITQTKINEKEAQKSTEKSTYSLQLILCTKLRGVIKVFDSGKNPECEEVMKKKDFESSKKQLTHSVLYQSILKRLQAVFLLSLSTLELASWREGKEKFIVFFSAQQMF